MARCSVFVDAGLPVGEALPKSIVGHRFDGEGVDMDAALAQIPNDLRRFVLEAAREASISAEGEGFVDRPSSGWWASAVL